MVLIANRLAREKAGCGHPLTVTFALRPSLLIIAVLLMVMRCRLSPLASDVFQSGEVIEIDAVWPLLWQLLAPFAAKEFLYRYMARVAVKVDSTIIMANALHARG